MDRMLDAADAVYWWLRHHLAITAGLVALVVAGLVGLASVTGGDDDDVSALPAGAVAVVGDATISDAELARWQAIYAKGITDVSAGAQPDTAATRKAAFELLVGSTFILEEAQRQKVEVPESRVDEGVAQYFTQSGATTQDAKQKILTELGIREADLRYQQRVSLLSTALRDKVAKAVPQPSAEEIAAAYERDPQRWAKPTERDLRAVVTRDEAAAKQARAALDGGATFAAVTKQYSADASLVEAKGVIKAFKPGTNSAVLERAVFSAPRGELQGPLAADGGWIVFQVQKITPLPAQDLQAATPAIRQNLLAATRTTATDEYVTGLRARWKARTRCTPRVQAPEFCGRA